MAEKPTYEELEQRVGELEKEVVELKQADNERETDDSKQKESLILLESVFNAIPDTIGIQDSIHGMIRYNEAGYRFLNMSHEEVKGKKCFELIGRTKPCEICATTEVYRTKAPARVEKYFKEFGVWFDVRAYPVRDEAGSITKIIEHLRDISEKKQKEKELQESYDLLEENVRQRTAELKEANEALQSELIDRKRTEKMLRKERDFTQSLIDTAQVIILVLDVKGRILSFNSYMEKLSGYRLEEVKGKDWFTAFLPEQDFDHIRALFRKAVSDIQTRGNINPIIAKDGREIFTEWYDKTLKDTDGNIIGILCIGQDITDRKKAEEALQKSTQRLLKAQEVARMGFLDWNLKTNEMYWSDEIYNLYGINRQHEKSNIDRTMELVHPDDQEFVNKNLDMAIQGVKKYDIDHRKLLPDGKVIWVHAQAELIRDAEGNPESLLGTEIDITDRKRYEDMLREIESRLREANQIMAGVLDHTHMMAGFFDPEFKFFLGN